VLRQARARRVHWDRFRNHPDRPSVNCAELARFRMSLEQACARSVPRGLSWTALAQRAQPIAQRALPGHLMQSRGKDQARV
jgi:hypothetical protein